MGNVVDPEKEARLKAEVKMENEVEFELKALNLNNLNFGSKNKIDPYQDITGDDAPEEDDKKNNRRIRPPIRKQQKEVKVSTSKVNVSSTLEQAVKKEVGATGEGDMPKIMTMNWNNIELMEVKAEIKEEFDRDDELGEFNMDDDNIDRED